MNRRRQDAPKLLLIPPVAFFLAVLCWPVIRYIGMVFGKTFATVLLLCTVLLGAMTLLSYGLPVGRLRSMLRWCGAFFYPLFLTALPLLLIEDAIFYFFDLSVQPKLALARLFGAFLLLAGVGLIAGFRLRTRRCTVSLPNASPCRLVLISDLHLGRFTPAKFGEELTEAVLKAAPDAVVIAGDLFDDRFESLSPQKRERIRASFQKLSVALPVYACEGNHDILYEDERKNAFLKSCGIRMLYDESVSVQNIPFLFRRDVKNPDRIPGSELFPQSEKPAVVVDHAPYLYEEAWKNGAWLVMSGHTHAGQTFPATLLYKTILRHGYGLSRKGDKQLLVTSGTGFCGCPVRLGAAREIVVVEIRA